MGFSSFEFKRTKPLNPDILADVSVHGFVFSGGAAESRPRALSEAERRARWAFGSLERLILLAFEWVSGPVTGVEDLRQAVLVGRTGF